MTKVCALWKVNVMTAFAQMTQGARASTDMILTQISRNSPDRATEMLNYWYTTETLPQPLTITFYYGASRELDLPEPMQIYRYHRWYVSIISAYVCQSMSLAVQLWRWYDSWFSLKMCSGLYCLVYATWPPLPKSQTLYKRWLRKRYGNWVY